MAVRSGRVSIDTRRVLHELDEERPQIIRFRNLTESFVTYSMVTFPYTIFLADPTFEDSSRRGESVEDLPYRMTVQGFLLMDLDYMKTVAQFIRSHPFIIQNRNEINPQTARYPRLTQNDLNAYLADLISRTERFERRAIIR